MTARTVKFALNVWAGWAPIIFANEGFQAGKVWKTPSGEEFRVELVLIDDPVQMRDAYAAGEVHIGWATLDMLPLFMDGFVDEAGNPRDSRVMPRVFQQAFHVMRSGRPGPVLVDVPMDIFSAPLPVDAFSKRPAEMARPTIDGATAERNRLHHRLRVRRNGPVHVVGVDREIRVALDPARLEAFGVTADQVSQQLRRTNVDLPGGR